MKTKDTIIWFVIGMMGFLIFLTIAYIAIKQDDYNQCVSVFERVNGLWKPIVASTCESIKPWWVS